MKRKNIFSVGEYYIFLSFKTLSPKVVVIFVKLIQKFINCCGRKRILHILIGKYYEGIILIWPAWILVLWPKSKSHHHLLAPNFHFALQSFHEEAVNDHNATGIQPITTEINCNIKVSFTGLKQATFAKFLKWNSAFPRLLCSSLSRPFVNLKQSSKAIFTQLNDSW